MPDFKPSEDILSLSEFRTTLADCVARTRDTHRPIILTQNGRASSVFLDVADWEKIAEKLYHAELCEDLIVGEGEIERGETYAADDVGMLIDADMKKLARSANRRTQQLPVA